MSDTVFKLWGFYAIMLPSSAAIIAGSIIYFFRMPVLGGVIGIVALWLGVLTLQRHARVELTDDNLTVYGLTGRRTKIIPWTEMIRIEQRDEHAIWFRTRDGKLHCIVNVYEDADRMFRMVASRTAEDKAASERP